MTVQHIADPARGAHEHLVNHGMERDGLRFRVCMHPDQTVRDTEDGTITECDYCPAAAMSGPGLRTQLPTWLWQEGIPK